MEGYTTTQIPIAICVSVFYNALRRVNYSPFTSWAPS